MEEKHQKTLKKLTKYQNILKIMTFVQEYGLKVGVLALFHVGTGIDFKDNNEVKAITEIDRRIMLEEEELYQSIERMLNEYIK